MASIIRNVVHGQEYGNEGKKKWTQCGIQIEKDGRFYIKLTHLPVVPNDQEGHFFSVFDQDHNKKPRSAAGASIDPNPEDFDDDIPF